MILLMMPLWKWMGLIMVISRRTSSEKVKLTTGHNIQGAQQPAYMHIGASSPDVYYGRVRQPGQGIGSVTSRDDRVCGLHLNIDGAHMLLGLWWLEAASRGGPAQLPVVNVHPVVEAGGEVDGV